MHDLLVALAFVAVVACPAMIGSLPKVEAIPVSVRRKDLDHKA